MVSIQIGLSAADLLRQMGKMREWLDANHVEAAEFSYSDSAARLVFRRPADADRFSRHFAPGSAAAAAR